MKIGIFGGSFDPVHNGHVGIAKKALEELGLDRLAVVPAAVSPFKADEAGQALFDAPTRLMLVRAAFNGIERVVVDDREILRGGTSYAIDTVRQYAGENPDAQLYFIIGEDSRDGLPRWKEYDTLKTLCRFVAYPRTPESSTHIRSLLAADADIASLVPDAVALFIRHHVRENADSRLASTVRAGLVRKAGYCPCRLPKLPEFFCPCEEFRGQLADPSFHGLCHCRLYDKP